tara:strand:- start:2321 stop:2731 length:411 start_codon:yes stop_codon:yes gene_type:complete
MTVNDKLLAIIRTGVPAAIGALIAWLVGRIPAVADVIVSIDAFLSEAGLAGVTVLGVLNAVVLGLVIAGYYWLARELGARFPVLEKWLLGSSVVPDYSAGAALMSANAELAQQRPELERLRAIDAGETGFDSSAPQ